MSSRHLLVLTALTVFFLARGTAAQNPPSVSIAELLLRDDIQAVETRLVSAPNTAENIAFQGEVEYRKGHFDRAEVFYRSALQKNEKTARAHFGLGKLALAHMQTGEALRRLSRAIELDADEPLYRFYISETLGLEKKSKEATRQLETYLKLNPADPDRVPMAQAAVDVANAFGKAEIAKVDGPDQPAPIPVQRMLNFIFADVMVDQRGPYRFLVDTGATQTVVSERVANDLGLEKIATNVLFGLGGEGRVDSPIYRAGSLRVGDITVHDVPLGTLTNPLLSMVMDGILGPSLLSDYVVTIDYPRSQIELLRNASKDGILVPVWCFNGLLLTPVEVNGKYSGNFLIDTGADTTLLAHAMAHTLGVTKDTPGASLNLPIGGIGGLDDGVLQVPSITLKTPFASRQFDTMMAVDLGSLSGLIQTELSGVIGYDVLKDYRVTLNYRKAEIWLNK